MFLVDTSVWVDHLRRGVSVLARALEDDQVLCHPAILGELALGNPRARNEVLSLLRLLPQALTASDEEVLAMVERYQLHGRGVGWVDAHLIASARLSQADLWSGDRRLCRAAQIAEVETRG